MHAGRPAPASLAVTALPQGVTHMPLAWCTVGDPRTAAVLQGWPNAAACLAAMLFLTSQQLQPCAAQQTVYSPGRGGTAYTPTALAAINKEATAPAPAAGKDGAAGGSVRPEPPAPSGGGGGPGGPPPYTVLAGQSFEQLKFGQVVILRLQRAP